MEDTVNLYKDYLLQYHDYLINVEDSSITNYAKETGLSIQFVTTLNDVFISFEDKIFNKHARTRYEARDKKI